MHKLVYTKYHIISIIPKMRHIGQLHVEVEHWTVEVLTRSYLKYFIIFSMHKLPLIANEYALFSPHNPADTFPSI